MTTGDWLIIWRDISVCITWAAAVIFIISGLQDLVYDAWLYWWHFVRRTQYGNRERISLARLRAREQQQIAVMIPAWNEGAIIGNMVENLLERSEYRNYHLFVGTYPNDPETQAAVDALSQRYPQVIKVVTAYPGPTNKADCLNHIYRAIQAWERSHNRTFDIFVMHDAEDFVHPYSFMLYNYLIPRVDVVQVPILPLPTAHWRWTHWVYADEFTENHMKDVVVREKMGGFVPYAGVGTGFSRRAFDTLTLHQDGELFNEWSMTEDYSMSMRTVLAGLRSIFVNTILSDDDSPWYVPLCKRKNFIANWAYFPMEIKRSIRQKTRWIIGISLQEWENSGWEGDWKILENLIKDRKVFVSVTANTLGYFILLYFFISMLGRQGFVPFMWLPIWERGSALYVVVLVTTALMVLRFIQRFVYTARVYGVVAGLLSVPRMVYGNVISAIAAYRALNIFAQVRAGKSEMQWDKTAHEEGVGAPPQGLVDVFRRQQQVPFDYMAVLSSLQSGNKAQILHALQTIPRALPAEYRVPLLQILHSYLGDTEYEYRAMAVRISGYLMWPELGPAVCARLFDKEWVVRANSARALLKFPNLQELLPTVFAQTDRYALEVLVREMEQNEHARERIFGFLHLPEFTTARNILLEHSDLLAVHFSDFLNANWQRIDLAREYRVETPAFQPAPDLRERIPITQPLPNPQ